MLNKVSIAKFSKLLILLESGNNGAHNNSVNLNEKLEDVQFMFSLINFVADKMITQKKEIDGLYDGLPDGIKNQIKNRDKKEV